MISMKSFLGILFLISYLYSFDLTKYIATPHEKLNVGVGAGITNQTEPPMKNLEPVSSAILYSASIGIGDYPVIWHAGYRYAKYEYYYYERGSFVKSDERGAVKNYSVLIGPRLYPLKGNRIIQPFAGIYFAAKNETAVKWDGALGTSADFSGEVSYGAQFSAGADILHFNYTFFYIQFGYELCGSRFGETTSDYFAEAGIKIGE
ncbi:MAG: hypothetical protein ACLFQK_09080 [Fibrobacterota bacterium]